MPEHLLPIYAYLFLFISVFLDRAGMPIPAAPVLVAAGALAAGGRVQFLSALLAGLIAALIADAVWFLVGRTHGHRVLKLICRLSCEPAVCVRRTQNLFGRHPVAALVVARFVPGLATLTAPVAGQCGMRLRRFLLMDGAGTALWAGLLLGSGYFLRDALARRPSLLFWAGKFSGLLLAASVFSLFLLRFARRRLAMKELIAARMDPVELKRQLDAGEKVAVVDLRHPLELLAEPFVLPGAIHLSPENLTARQQTIPRDRDLVLYCTCPSEATSARTAMRLRRLGFERVRPLRGGYDEWKRLGFPLEEVRPAKLSEI